MNKLLILARSLHKDESGAAFVEYSVLIGLILAVSVTTVGLVGTWSGARWVALEAALP